MQTDEEPIPTANAETAATFNSAFSSNVFTFLIGSQKQRFTLHTDLVRKISAPLAAMIDNGTMQESITRSVTITDVAPMVFDLFAQFVYTGSYEVKAATDNSAESISKKDTVNTLLPVNEYYCTTCGDKNKISTFRLPNKQSMWCNKHCFDNSYDYRAQGPLINFCSCCGGAATTSGIVCLRGEQQQQKINVDRLQDAAAKAARSIAPRLLVSFTTLQPSNEYESGEHDQVDTDKHLIKPTAQLVLHAKLFILADRYLVHSLARECLRRLHRDLAVFRPSAENVDTVMELLQYIYDNTSEDHGKSLRSLVTAYVVAQAKILMEFDAFAVSVIEDSRISMDIMKAMAQKL